MVDLMEFHADLMGHKKDIYSVAFSPDGRLLASGSWDMTIKLWDVASQKLIHTLEGGAISVVFSPDGRLLASGSWRNTIKLWDMVGKKLIHTIEGRRKSHKKGHKGSVRSVAFSPDGKLLASGSDDKTIKLWDVASKKLIHTLKGHGHTVKSVAFSPDGKMLASGSSHPYVGGDVRTIKLWDVASKKIIHTLEGQKSNVISVAFAPDGKLLASGLGDKTIKLWDVTSQKLIQTLMGHDKYVTSVIFSPDGKMLASGSGDKTVRLWINSTVVRQQKEREEQAREEQARQQQLLFEQRARKEQVRQEQRLAEQREKQFIEAFHQELTNPSFDGGVGKVSIRSMAEVSGMDMEKVSYTINQLVRVRKITGVRLDDQGTPGDVTDHYWIALALSPASPASPNEDHLPAKQQTTLGNPTVSPTASPTIQEYYPKPANRPQHCLFCNTELQSHELQGGCPSCRAQDPPFDTQCMITRKSLTNEFQGKWTTCIHCHRPAIATALLSWLHNKDSCPACRQELKETYYAKALSDKEIADKIDRTIALSVSLNIDQITSGRTQDVLQKFELQFHQRSANRSIDQSGQNDQTRLMTILEERLMKKLEIIEFQISNVYEQGERQHQVVLGEFSKLVQPIRLIEEFAKQVDTMDFGAILQGLEEIRAGYEVIVENVDYLVEEHQKNKGLRAMVKSSIGNVGSDMALKQILDSGVGAEMEQYSSNPTKRGLKSLLGRIGVGIKNNAANPQKWVKLAAAIIVV